MRRTAVLLAMLIAILWQSLALARVGSTVNALADPEHAALHWQDEGHHHHDDGSYQLDDSNASVQHVLSDHAGTTPALMVAAAYHFPSLESATPRGVHETPVPDPTLDRLLRPPRPRS
ncbi:hypothetical protein BURC_00238 [Burkholderiaceae bacterium]|nr:hypothetical protein BURC_00238 [Burkholderiaceae bacterium]